MYRFSVDNSITYSSEDLVLFKESPFASWMERLSLENPDHGIVPDDGSDIVRVGAGSPAKGSVVRDDRNIELMDWNEIVLRRQTPSTSEENQSDKIAESLGVQGKRVVLVDHPEDEFQRREETQNAMQTGVDLIVNGQLASGPLSDSVDLLMRTSSFSDLGNYLYIPCDTGPKTTPHSAFRLCFIADLLHSLQGQLPPQMLIIRGDSDMVALPIEDHIYYYRAVKQRFMDAQRSFRKHRMPDPAASSHFGRWSNCAKDVLRQRATSESGQADAGPVGEDDNQAAPEPVALPPEKRLHTAQEEAFSTQAIANSPVEHDLPQDLASVARPRAGDSYEGEFTAAAHACHPVAKHDYVDLDSGSLAPTLVATALEQGRSAPAPTIGVALSSRYSLIDRDAVPLVGENVAKASAELRRSSTMDADEPARESSVKPLRPFSSVLATSEGGDYG